MRGVLVLVVVLAGGCLKTGEFRCETSTDCDRAGALGTCQGVGYCSFPDPGCEGGQRFGDFSSSFSNTCVDVTGTFSVGGTVSGLTGSLTLANNGGDSLTLPGNGPFTFGARLADGVDFGVSVTMRPAAQSCLVTNGSGTIAGADVIDVIVTCGATTNATVLCATGVNCPLATEFCCFDRDLGTGVCQATGLVCGTQRVECDSAEDCGGGPAVCCATYKVGKLKNASCEQSVSTCTTMGTVELFCDPTAGAAACPGGMACSGTATTLSPGYMICQ